MLLAGIALAWELATSEREHTSNTKITLSKIAFTCFQWKLLFVFQTKDLYQKTLIYNAHSIISFRSVVNYQRYDLKKFIIFVWSAQGCGTLAEFTALKIPILIVYYFYYFTNCIKISHVTIYTPKFPDVVSTSV